MRDEPLAFDDAEESVIDRRLSELSRQISLLEHTVERITTRLDACLTPLYPKAPVASEGEMPKQAASSLANRLDHFAGVVEAQHYKLNELVNRFMTIKYNVSGAKARNGKEIAPMAFSDKAEAERFAKYHEGLSVPQNLRKHPGNISVVGTSNMEYPQLQNIPKSLSLSAQTVGRVTREVPDDGLIDRLLDKTLDRIKTYDPAKAISLADMQARYAEPLERSATVGNLNADLEEAYAMGFRAAEQFLTPMSGAEGYTETQDYVDQRRSDLKELVSYNRSI